MASQQLTVAKTLTNFDILEAGLYFTPDWARTPGPRAHARAPAHQARPLRPPPRLSVCTQHGAKRELARPFFLILLTRVPCPCDALASEQHVLKLFSTRPKATDAALRIIGWQVVPDRVSGNAEDRRRRGFWLICPPGNVPGKDVQKIRRVLENRSEIADSSG